MPEPAADIEDGPLPPDPVLAGHALALLRGLSQSQAAAVVIRSQDELWLRFARYETLGYFRLPSEEFEGVEWPAVVLRATSGRPGGSVLSAVFAVYYDVEGGPQAAVLSAIPDASRAITPGS